ncbi:SDR family oxidoreductase [Falsiroseomonas selenitidurans]|uniref:SDR family oxidoreductase n=1 Tax=Falsiroseomonas selenitidurans TaxID=2716335 RepID=A0ABX1E9W0_9PROT|nr:SDR family oxidoreductase [Falsiroseomonas selenitidurans]NKC33585.1 SDR family oxidoreductase [Falsiroseomonas selenitidurans]
MDLGLKGKRALVMGASKGLGRAIADSLAAEGAALVVSGRDQAKLDAVAGELKAAGASAAFGVPADVGSAADMDRLADEAVRLLGGVDILVLNHGGPPPGSALEITEAQLAEWFPKIVLHPIRIATRLLPAMRAQKWGRIITVGSTGMVQPIPNLAISNILRAAIVGWNKSLSAEVAKENITCNILAPGAILTDRQKETQGAIAAKRGIPVEAVMEERAASIPAGRIGRAEEFGPLGAFLASDHAAYITGSILRVDGGIMRGF